MSNVMSIFPIIEINDARVSHQKPLLVLDNTIKLKTIKMKQMSVSELMLFLEGGLLLVVKPLFCCMRQTVFL